MSRTQQRLFLAVKLSPKTNQYLLKRVFTNKDFMYKSGFRRTWTRHQTQTGITLERQKENTNITDEVTDYKKKAIEVAGSKSDPWK